MKHCTTELLAKFNTPMCLEISATAKKLRPNTKHKIPAHLPRTPTTLRKIFEQAIEFNFIPKKQFFQACVQHKLITNARERGIFTILASRDGAAIYTDHILRTQRSCLYFLNLFSSWHITEENIGVLLDNAPRLMPRPYSIASSLLKSSPQHQPNTTIFRIVFSVQKPPGVASTMLRKIGQQFLNTRPDGPSPHLELYFRQSNHFKLTDVDLNIPIIMVAMGTGVAPFVGFLEHIHEQNRRRFAADENPHRFTWLIFGSRYKNKQIYKERLDEFHQNGTLNMYDQCFSRDTAYPTTTYIQEAIRNKSVAFAKRFMGKDTKVEGKIFVCGNRQMLVDVRDAVVESLVKGEYAVDWDAGGKQVKDLVAKHRYVEDVWLA